MNKPTICHISFNHSPFDDRIYWKELLSLQEVGYNTIHIAVDEIDSDYITDEGIRIVTIKRRRKHENKWINKFMQLFIKKNSTIEVIYSKAKIFNADIYHYHDLQINALVNKLKKLPQSPKVIYDAHEAYHLLMLEDMPKERIKKFLFKIYIYITAKWELIHASNCDYIIGTDEYTLEYFQKKLPEVKSTNVFNYSYFYNYKVFSQDKKYDLIYSGFMTPNRGIENIIRSLAIVKQKFQSIRLLLIGPFESKQFNNYIIDLICSLNLVENVIIQKPVPFEEMSNYYAQASIGLGLFNITPKYNTFIPIKLFEYMAFGLPVIFTDHGPASIIIREKNCGLIVEFSDYEMISNAIFQLLSDKVLFHKLSKNGMNAVENEFNWNIERDKLLAVYKKLLN